MGVLRGRDLLRNKTKHVHVSIRLPSARYMCMCLLGGPVGLSIPVLTTLRSLFIFLFFVRVLVQSDSTVLVPSVGLSG